MCPLPPQLPACQPVLALGSQGSFFSLPLIPSWPLADRLFILPSNNPLMALYSKSPVLSELKGLLCAIAHVEPGKYLIKNRVIQGPKVVTL